MFTNFFATDSTSVSTRFARGMNSSIKRFNDKSILKTASADKTANEAMMLEIARERNVPVPGFSVQVDDCTILMEYLPDASTIYDAIFTNNVWNSEMQLLIADAIISMWSAGIVHGDLNINNIVISRERAYIIDLASSYESIDAGLLEGAAADLALLTELLVYAEADCDVLVEKLSSYLATL